MSKYGRPAVPFPERFWVKVNKDGATPLYRPDLGPCWLWVAYTNRAGYGRIYADARQRMAHIVSWEMANGPVPQGLVLDHLCRVRNCVNPAHLEPVTMGENIRRGETGKITGARFLAKAACPLGHPYSGENLVVHADGKRRCRQCRRDRHHRAQMARAS